MSETFPVEWKRLFKSLSVVMSVSIIVPVVLLMFIRLVSSGFDYEKTFEHVSFPMSLFFLVCIPLVSIGFSFLIALWFRLATITISAGKIHGRNYWGIRNSIPLNDITKLTSFRSNGINAIVVNSQYHGQVYISEKTERLSELLGILLGHLPEVEKPSSAQGHG